MRWLDIKTGIMLLPVILLFITIVDSDSAMAGRKYSLRKTSFSALKGWRQDDHALAFSAYIKSCSRLLGPQGIKETRPNKKKRAKARYQAACRRSKKLGKDPSSAQVRRFFEKNFIPYQLRWRGRKKGLFTGYYEPEYEGALAPSEKYAVPVLQAPDNLIALGTRKTPRGFPRGLTSALQSGARLKPLPSRAKIENGALDAITKPLVWLADPVDAFFLHIQGSGRILLPGGGFVRLGFAGRNGHPYSSIGKVLSARGILKPRELSMKSVQKWLRDNKRQAVKILQSNKSYIFFRKVELDADLGPLGGEGIPLTAGRSLAIDRRFHAYGLPIWLDTQIPDEEARNYTKFRHLMIAQDTGAAIKGAIRGDIFFGTGKAAGDIAGRVKEPGRMYILLPKKSRRKAR